MNALRQGLPLLGLVAAGAEGASFAMRRGLPPRLLAGFAVAAILACAVLSFQRVEVFDNPESLRRDWQVRARQPPPEMPRRDSGV